MMARHKLRIVYSAEELDSFPDDVFLQNQVVFGSAPFNPLPELGLKDTINEFGDYNKDNRYKSRPRPWSIQKYAGASADGKDSLTIFVEGQK